MHADFVRRESTDQLHDIPRERKANGLHCVNEFRRKASPFSLCQGAFCGCFAALFINASGVGGRFWGALRANLPRTDSPTNLYQGAESHKKS